MVVHPNSLGNLTPFTGIGDPRMANGRNHGQTIIGWMNILGDWPEEKIQAVADDPDAPVSKRKAAKSHLRSMHDEYAKNGKPLALDDLNLQLDRTDGRPVQRVETVTHEVKDPKALRLEFMRVMAEHPELVQLFLAQVESAKGALPGAAVGAPKAREDGE